MASNKTRIAFFDYGSGIPYQIGMHLEFDIYQDAIDYAETFAQSVFGNAAQLSVLFYVYSYDNVSYRYYESGTEAMKEVITFPDNI